MSQQDVLVAGSTGGIGRALCERFEQSGQRVTKLRRDAGAALASSVQAGATLVTDYSSKHLAQLAAGFTTQGVEFDVVIVATGVLHDGDLGPEKRLADLDEEKLTRYFATNTILPAMMLRAFAPLLPRQTRSVFACLSALVGSISENRLGGWYGYRASKAALNMLVKTTAIEMRRTHKQACIAALHPGTTKSGLSQPFTANTPQDKLYTAEQTAQRLQSVIAGLGPDDSGGLFHWDGSRVAY